MADWLMNHKIFWFRKINVWIRTTNECALIFLKLHAIQSSRWQCIWCVRFDEKQTPIGIYWIHTHTHTLLALLKATASTFYSFSKHEKKPRQHFYFSWERNWITKISWVCALASTHFFRNIKNRNLLVLCLWFTCLNCILSGTKSQQRNAVRTHMRA